MFMGCLAGLGDEIGRVEDWESGGLEQNSHLPIFLAYELRFRAEAGS